MTPSPHVLEISWKWAMPTIVLSSFVLLDLYAGFIFKGLHLTFFWIPLYCWTLHRPALIHPVTLFAAGFLYDAFLFLPLGLHSLIYICFYVILILQRQSLIRQPFLMLWGIFSLLMVAVNGAIFWFLGDLSQYRHILGASLVEIVAYPLVVRGLFHIKEYSMESAP